MSKLRLRYLMLVMFVAICIPVLGLRCRATVPINHTTINVYSADWGDATGSQVVYTGLYGWASWSPAYAGVFDIVPGTNWANFIDAPSNVGPFIKNETLNITSTASARCSGVFVSQTFTQQGLSIRCHWPLLMALPGTTWDLTIVFGTRDPWDDGGSGNGPSYTHTYLFHWTVVSDLSHLKALLYALHDIELGTSGVTVVSDETVFGTLSNLLDSAIAYQTANDLSDARSALIDFEAQVMDDEITTAPPTPAPTGAGTGIMNSSEWPTACRLLIDADWVYSNTLGGTL